MEHATKEQLIAFETRVKELWEAGELPYLIHLCGGNEDQLIKIFQDIQPGDWVFSTHRNHYHALLSGMDADVLLEKIKRGDSMFVFGARSIAPQGELAEQCSALPVHFLTSSVLAGTCGIAVGVAWTIKNDCCCPPGHMIVNCPVHNGPVCGRSPRVWCFLGDGAEDEGHFYEAVCFADGHHLPITFVIEDNDRSVDTDKATRRGVAQWQSSRLLTLAWPPCVRRYEYTPTYPHAGSGCQHHIVFKTPHPGPLPIAPPTSQRGEGE
jgi:pyruvate dehydrogenase E1 component alpha subunit